MIQKDLRLLNNKPLSKRHIVPVRKSQHNKQFGIRKRLRSNIRYPQRVLPHSSFRGVTAISGIHFQEDSLSLYGHVIWPEVSTTNLPSKPTPCNQQDQSFRNLSNSKHKRYNPTRLKPYETGSNSIKGNFIPRKSWIAHLQQISSDSFITSQISRLRLELQKIKYATPRRHSKEVNLQDPKIQKQVKKKISNTNQVLILIRRKLQLLEFTIPLSISSSQTPVQHSVIRTSLTRLERNSDTITKATKRLQSSLHKQPQLLMSVVEAAVQLSQFTGNLQGSTVQEDGLRSGDLELTINEKSTLIISENLGIKIKATNLQGKYYQEADAVSIQNRAGDQSFRQEVHLGITSQIRISPTIDLFANSRTALTRRYCTITFDRNAIARDTFTIPWKGETPIIHPPFPFIG
ncbi:MAG: hypothetical protein EZS28_001577 [Streblomastix strix]|uniref:Uncharacterized protein n=1 Tax=Streblomastix strix TaxID=222440 RepID=A0A5J4X8F7_9EUKA|nr:MAG: hypothetical protein EZS28_001577 [Streblomastix strix]